MKSSSFNLIGGRFIFKDDEVAYFVQKQNYAGKLIDKVREVENRKGPDFAMKMLEHMEVNDLKYEIRKANDFDKIKAVRHREDELNRDSRGTKYSCKCGIYFYDLSKSDHVCPGCKTPKEECTRIG